MTDNEVVKALECCCSEEVQCRNCTLPQNVKDSLECGTVIAKECLDLINRQKAEIEFLKEQRDRYMQDATDFSIKVEQLKTENELLKMAGDA